MSRQPVPSDQGDRPALLAQALRYASLGLCVIPLRRPEWDSEGKLKRDERGALIDGKKPSVSWRPYEKRHPTADEIRTWFRKAGRNLAIVTGAISGVVVVDADSPEAVGWVDENLPQTPMRTRTSRGVHYFFKHPGGVIPNGVKLHGMPLDVRGDGGYVVAPGSLHQSRFIYLEEGDWGPLDSLPPFDPAWLGKVPPPSAPAPSAPAPRLITSERETLIKRAKAYMAKSAPAVEGQGGDARTYWACCTVLNDFGLSVEDSLESLADWNSRCVPPWDEKDLRAKLQSAERSANKKPRGIRQMDEAPNTSRTIPFPDTGPTPDREAPPPPPAIPWEEDEPGEPSAWAELKKHYTPSGWKVKRWGGNLAKILRLDPRWGPRLSLDIMRQQVCFDKKPIPEHFPDLVQEQIEETHQTSFGREEILSKIRAQASENPFHPVRDFLNALPPWDQVDRLLSVAPDVLGAIDPLSQHYFKLWAIGAVRRVMEPGCQMDNAMVLIGPQGKGKSSFWGALAGPFFSDTPIDLDSKDRFQALASAWIVELPELDWMTSSKTAEAIKAFLTSREDHYRPPYAKEVLKVPRHSVCVGSTNRDQFLNDPTGSRRFWPVRIGDFIDLDLLRFQRDQLWAEAIHLWKEGHPHWLSTDLDADREHAAEAFTTEDPWEGLIQDALEKLKQDAKKDGRSFNDEGFTMSELLTRMSIPAQQQTKPAGARCSPFLRALGYYSKQFQIRGVKAHRWRPLLNLAA